MEHILNVIRVKQEDSRDGLAVEVKAELRMAASMAVSYEAARRQPGALEYAEEHVVRSLLHALYGGIEARLQEIGPLAIASARDDGDAMRIARGFQDVLELIGSKRDVMQSMVVQVVDEGVGYPELYFNENRFNTSAGEMT